MPTTSNISSDNADNWAHISEKSSDPIAVEHGVKPQALDKSGRAGGIKGGAANPNIGTKTGDPLEPKIRAQDEILKLQQEIESLKNGNLSDPITIKYLQKNGGVFSPDQQSSKSKGIFKDPDSSQNSNYVSSDHVKSFTNYYPERNFSDASQSPQSTHADWFGGSSNRSVSPISRGKKSVSGISSSLDSHTYFNEFLEHDPEGVNEQYHFNTTTGIHGNTSKVVASQHRRKAWDWNILPKVGSSVLVRAHSFNVISVPIDGEIKQILYNPSYNKKFRTMNIFISFNLDTKPSDSLLHARRRLISFGNYITHYLKSRMYAYQCYPFFIQGLSEEDMKSKTYSSVNSSHDYLEIEAIIELWHLQAQKYFGQANSAFFSAEVVQSLLQRKSQVRHQSTLQNAILTPEKSSTTVPPKGLAVNSVEEIDILLLRPLADTQLGWQMAYDEPNLNIADYPLDLSPWRLREENSDRILGSHHDGSESSQVKIVSDEADLDQLTADNAGEYLFDCMDRKIGSLEEEAAKSGNQVLPNYNEELHGKTGEVGDNNKKKPGKAAKRSGLANLFKRKHTSIAPQTSVEVAEPVTVENKVSKRTQSIQNAWLEDYFSRYLANYKRVGLPTQYFLPEDITTSKSHNSTDDEKSEAKKAYLFSKESLQIRLPFGNNTIPTICAPWIWSCLSYNKWKPLLREMYRCIVPGGYALGTAYDLRIANTFTSSSEELLKEFPSTLERDKTFDAIALKAINDGVHIFPTQYLVQAFKDVGFSNIKFSLLSFKTGDLSTDMGCLNELFSQVVWDVLLRREIPDPSKPPKDTNPTTLFQRYIREHMGKIDENAGCFRILLVVAQKSKKSALS